MGNGNIKPGTIRRVVHANKRFWEALDLWKEDRMDREHWREVIRDAPAVVYRRKQKLIESKDDELLEEFHKLLEGQMPQETRAVLTTKEIALFLSSTFTDMKTERDLLMEDVYPYLREFCRRLGYEFSVADMRWGVRDQMTDEHQAVQICVTEVQRCRRGSVGPYMACIIGEKYGYRPLPVSIAKELFEMLLECVRTHRYRGGKDSSELLEKWYRLDENSIPAVYVLQPVSTYYPYAYKNRVAPNSDNAQQEKYLWWKESELMRAALTEAASEIDFTAFAFSNVSEKDFVVSITEKEIMTGVQGDDTDPRYMFLFLRSRRDLSMDGNGNHIDATKHCVHGLRQGAEVGNSESGLLKRLKDTCEKHFLLSNTFRYNVEFHMTNDGHIDARNNQEEMKKFCDKFCQFMVDGIQEAIANHNVIDDPLFNEVLHHTMVANRRTDTFVGRAHCLRKVEAYLKLDHGSKLFIVYGISGCGKTSILAKAFNSSLKHWNGVETGRPVHVIRFLGTSPASSNVRSLLGSLCNQLCLVLKDTSSIVPNNYDHLVATFRSLLQRATAEKSLVLFLDSLDQLSDQDDGRALGWLPVNLPRNVHIVVSTLPNLGGCLNVLRTKLKQKNNSDNYLEVSSLEANDAESILNMRLEKASRRLTATQRAQVLGACPKPTALYMKLACDTALRWKSFTTNTDRELKATATQMITLLFERLITTHGEQFVRRALGYITASRTGLTKTELEDILSCDDIVLDDDVFKYHVPLVRRLPTSLWTRLRNDLGSYLVEVTADGHVVYRWYHRQFLEAAQIYFLSDKPFTDSLHVELANYFNGRWAREAKPYTDREGKVKSAYRMVANQPLILNTNGTDRFNLEHGETGPRYNLRKLSELPFHLIKAEMWNEFAEIVCKIPWLTAKCKTGKAFELALELSEACLRCNTEKSTIMEDVYSCIRANAQQLSQFAELVPQLCLNEPDSSHCSLIAQEYLEKVNTSSGEKVILWRDLTKLQSRKTNVATFQHPTAVRKCFLSKGCKFLATFATDGTLRVFMVASGSTVMTTRCDCRVIGFPANEDQCHWIAVLGSDFIVRYSLGSGGNHEGSTLQEIKLDCDVDNKAGVVINKKGKAWEIFLATSQGKIRLYSTSSSNGRPVLKEELPRKPKILAISPDGKSLAFGSDKLYLWNSKSLKDTRVFETGKKAANMEGGTLRFSSNGSKLGAVLANGTYIWSTQSGKLLKTLAMNSLEVEFIVFAPDLDYIASPSFKDKEDVLVFCMAPKPYDKSPAWETLKGHSSMVRGCCINNRANGHPLIATAADDCTVQLWDTRNMPSPKVATWPEHLGSVQDCAFSSDETLAVSCSATETWVWQLQSPVKRLQQLYPPSNAASRTGPCFSEDNQFVAVFVKSGVDVWNLKSGVVPHGADSSLLLGAHRTLTFLDVRHLFTAFTSDGLYCSLVTDSEPDCVRLYLAINKYTLGRWAKHEPAEPPPKDLNHQEAFEQRFSVEEGRQIAAAAISNTCGRLAVISVPRHRLAQEPMTGPTEVHIWDLNTHATWKTHLCAHPTVEHVLKMGFDFLVTLVQGRKIFSARGSKEGEGQRTSHASSRASEAIVHVINGRGATLQTFHIPGMFSGLSGVNSEASFRSVLGRMVAYGLQDGVAKAQHIESGRFLGTFTVNNTQITVVRITSSGKSAVVGCANGNVHIIKLG